MKGCLGTVSYIDKKTILLENSEVRNLIKFFEKNKNRDFAMPKDISDKDAEEIKNYNL